MRRSEAEALLGVSGDDPATLRAAYRRRLRAVHPDLNPSPGAAEATRVLTAAYRLLTGERREAPEPAVRPAPGRPAPASSATATSTPPPGVRVLDDNTLSVDGTREEVLDALVDAADRLGELVFLDAPAGLLEVLVEFEGWPTGSLVLSLQGRADATVEVFCTVEPLSGGPAPPPVAVTRLVAATVAATSGDPAGGG